MIVGIHKLRNYFAGFVDEMVSKQECFMSFNHTSIKKEEQNDDVGVQTRNALSNNQDLGEMIEDLRLCLPIWVTRDQMLHLLTISNGNIVDATSEFYERETEYYEQLPANDVKITTIKTEYYEQVPATDVKISAIRTTPKNDSAAVPPKSPVRDTGHPSLINVPSLDKKLPSLTHSTKATVSSKKRGSVPDKKSKKKVKTTAAMDSGGSKQSAITKFFKKQDSVLASTGSLQPAITKFFKKAVPDNSQASEDSDAAKPYKNI